MIMVAFYHNEVWLFLNQRVAEEKNARTHCGGIVLGVV